jgi:hypothetical protein
MTFNLTPRALRFFGFSFGLFAAVCTGFALGGFYWENIFQPYTPMLLLGAILTYQWASYFRATERHVQLVEQLAGKQKN